MTNTLSPHGSWHTRAWGMLSICPSLTGPLLYNVERIRQGLCPHSRLPFDWGWNTVVWILLICSSLQTLVNCSLKVFAPWSVKISSGIPYFSAMFCTNTRSAVSASCARIGIAGTFCYILGRQDVPVLFSSHPVGPTIFNAHLSKGWLAVVVISMVCLASGTRVLVQLATLTLSHFSVYRFFGHSCLFLISLNVLFVPRWPTGESWYSYSAVA
jgi:hypothetical protein